MKVADIVFTKGVSGYFFDDQRAIREGAGRDGFFYRGRALTDGFEVIRLPGECISVGLLPEGGGFVFGDCCAVQYSGAGGREPVFRADQYLPFLENRLKPLLIGRSFHGFREACRFVDGPVFGGDRRLHAALRYGLSQAFLAAFAMAGRRTMAEVIAGEYSLTPHPRPVKILGQCGESLYDNVDKMILKKVDILPHGLINSIDEKFGRRGEKLAGYVSWIRDRVLGSRRDEHYRPEIHIDVYGLPGEVFGNDTAKITDYLAVLARAAEPFFLRVEGPVQAGSREEQLQLMKKLTSAVDASGLPVELVADEWCNTAEDIDRFSAEAAGHMLQIKTPDLGGIDASVESVLLCRRRGMKAYLGGTCNETDISARACTHAAMAARPYQMLAKPGMGFDEGYMTVYNEMQRIICVMSRRDAENGARS